MADTTQIDERNITDEKIERLRRRIGIIDRWRGSPTYAVSDTDSFRRVAEGAGDDNPLFTDPEYGKRSRWGTSIGSPMYVFATGLQDETPWTEEEKEAMSGGDPLRGSGQYLSGERWAFIRPVTPGVRMHMKNFLHDVEVRDSEFGGGRIAVLTHRMVFTDDEGGLLAIYEQTYHHADRTASRETGKYREVEIPRYTDEEIQAIDDVYDNEFRRGSDKLLINDVAVGDELPLMVKGPLTVTDVVCHHAANGIGSMARGPLKLARANRKRKAGFYTKNPLNVWDCAQRCHWEDDYAQQLGHPAAYDYGLMRTSWLLHFITNWIGDDAWITRMSSQLRRFNYIGDTTWIQGRVSAVHADQSPPAVDVVMEGVNQRGETTCLGTATVLVCRPDGTVPELPDLGYDDIPHHL